MLAERDWVGDCVTESEPVKLAVCVTEPERVCETVGSWVAVPDWLGVNVPLGLCVPLPVGCCDGVTVCDGDAEPVGDPDCEGVGSPDAVADIVVVGEPDCVGVSVVLGLRD